ncbi:MAG: hypothetical protein ACP5KV_04155 [Candidatus Methanomethylicaceae archaeon]
MQIDVSNSPRRKQLHQILMSLLLGDEVIRDGYLIVNNIGLTTYISFDHFTPEELRAIADFKEQVIEKKQKN